MSSISAEVINYLVQQKQTSRGKIRAISKSTDIPLPWLYKVASRKIPTPQADRIFVLKEFIDNEAKEAEKSRKKAA